MNRIIFVVVLFAVLMFALGVRAAAAGWVSLPQAEELLSFFPIVFKQGSIAADYPSGVLYIFPSTATTDGTATRPGMQAICFNEDPDAHFCNKSEVANSMRDGSYFKNPFVRSWVESAPDGEWVMGCCNGWTEIEIGNTAFVIIDNAQRITTALCSEELPVACCKQIP